MLERLQARDELEAVLAEPLPVRELLLRLDDLIVASWSFDSASPTASPGRSQPQHGRLTSR